MYGIIGLSSNESCVFWQQNKNEPEFEARPTDKEKDIPSELVELDRLLIDRLVGKTLKRL